MRLVKLFVAVLAIASLGLVPTVAGAAVVQPTLNGENLGAFTGAYANPDFPQPGTVTVNGTCNDSGPSTFTFTADGTNALGPFPGTFHATGNFTLSSPDSPTGDNLVAFHEDFTINSPNGEVTGSKDLDTIDSFPYVLQDLGIINANSAECVNHQQTPDGMDSTRAGADGLMLYTATIQTSDGTYTDHGRVISGVNQYLTGPNNDPYGATFSEIFKSDLFAITPPPTAGTPATVTLTPADAVNPVSTTHTVTSSVQDASGLPVAGVTVLFSVRGASATSGACSTDASGTCSYTYSGPDMPGADMITGCADSNSSGVADPDEPCGIATKAWVLPAATQGQTTGGGHIYNSTGTDKIAFGFTAKSDANGIKGECTVVDPSANKAKIKCTDVTDLVQSGTHATLFGDATVNGVATTYRIDVDDLAEPGAGKDTFKIHTASGYAAGGVLIDGNIQIHS